jgi:hypothetical protein
MNKKLLARVALSIIAVGLALVGCSPAPPPPLVARDVAPLAVVDPAQPCSRAGAPAECSTGPRTRSP